jgi:hypothetical protein
MCRITGLVFTKATLPSLLRLLSAFCMCVCVSFIILTRSVASRDNP